MLSSRSCVRITVSMRDSCHAYSAGQQNGETDQWRECEASQEQRSTSAKRKGEKAPSWRGGRNGRRREGSKLIVQLESRMRDFLPGNSAIVTSMRNHKQILQRPSNKTTSQGQRQPAFLVLHLACDSHQARTRTTLIFEPDFPLAAAFSEPAPNWQALRVFITFASSLRTFRRAISDPSSQCYGILKRCHLLPFFLQVSHSCLPRALPAGTDSPASARLLPTSLQWTAPLCAPFSSVLRGTRCSPRRDPAQVGVPKHRTSREHLRARGTTHAPLPSKQRWETNFAPAPAPRPLA